MSNQEQKNNIISIVILVAAALAIVSFFLPLVNIYDLVEYSAYKFITEGEIGDGSPVLMLICSAVTSIVTLIFSLSALKKSSATISTVVCSVLSVVCMMIAMNTELALSKTLMDYASTGFTLFVVAHVVVIAAGVYKAVQDKKAA